MKNTDTAKNFLPKLAAATAAAVLLGLIGSGCSIISPRQAKSPATPALDTLPLFTAADVPAFGPEEIPVDPPNWKVSPLDTSLPGKGLAQHPMLYIGEGCNKMFLVNDGKLIWTYSTGKGWEYDDIWLLSNGNILFSRMQYAAEITPQKKVVWRLDSPPGAEMHTVQPIGLDKVLLLRNGTPARVMLINKKTGVTEIDREIPDAGAGVHGQFRRFRMTASGTYLAPFLSKGKVVEYDKDFNEIWSYPIAAPWAAVRLHNGNTLITGEKDQVTREVNSKGETVWEFDLKTDLPPGISFNGSQSCVRLANGNTVICSRGGGGANCQLIEVTPDKKVVWALKDWTNLGPATAVQLLDDPGIPENPGDLQR
jgi:outer membrane protein assembly factor BamB